VLLCYQSANRDEAVRTLVKYNPTLRGQEAHEREGMDAVASLMVTPDSRARGLGLPSWPASNHQPVASRISTLT